MSVKTVGFEWYLNGKYHRENGLAREINRYKEWYKHGVLIAISTNPDEDD